VQTIVDNWRQEYNNFRPHSSLGYLTPVEFASDTTIITRWRLDQPRKEQELSHCKRYQKMGATYYREEKRRRSGHYEQGWTIMEPSGGRTVATEVSIILEGQSVPLSLTTYT